VEESPSPAVTPEIRDAIGNAAVSLAKAVGYRNAGTVEFLLSPDGELSFLEMNTRLQVEHPVTELVAGIDIVAEQLRIAAGEPLGYDELSPRGHAIECRINAENPATGFMPSPGLITRWDEPSGPWIRVDAGFGAGREIPQTYDSLVAKLVCFGATREQARLRTLRALAEFAVDGIATTIPFHRALLAHDAFVRGEVWTRFVEDALLDELPSLLESLPPVAAKRSAATAYAPADATVRSLVVEVGGRRFDVSVTERGVRKASKLERRAGGHGADGAHDEVRARMNGTILKVLVEQGQEVEAGELLCTLEAMKMENHILAPRTGTVVELGVKAGASVETGALIAVIE
jgi:acetyl-CoA/propionyl-CoA carboxylase biotin carboxyl carrier protein